MYTQKHNVNVWLQNHSTDIEQFGDGRINYTSKAWIIGKSVLMLN